MPKLMVGATTALVTLGVAFTVVAGPLMGLSDRAAIELADRDSYVAAVAAVATDPANARTRDGNAMSPVRRVRRHVSSTAGACIYSARDRRLADLRLAAAVGPRVVRAGRLGDRRRGAGDVAVPDARARDPRVDRGRSRVVLFFVRFLYDVVVASAHVATLAVRPGPAPSCAVIGVDLHTKSDLLLTLVGEVLSLVPGSLVVEVDRASTILYLHVLGVETLEDVERERARALAVEARMIRAFGSPADRERLERNLRG